MELTPEQIAFKAAAEERGPNETLHPEEGFLEVGSRVTHWNGDLSTHGLGTIAAMNGIQKLDYLESNFSSAVGLAGKAGLVDGLVNSMYDGGRCPYVVQWDYNPFKPEYANGYRDVYEKSSVRPYTQKPAVTK